MPNRIEVALKDGVRDARGERIRREIEHFLHLAVDEVRTLDVYTVDLPIDPNQLEQAAAGPFSDPVIQEWSIDRPLASGFDYAVEVGFRPGVTDNVGRTAREAVEYLTGRSFEDGRGSLLRGTVPVERSSHSCGCRADRHRSALQHPDPALLRSCRPRSSSPGADSRHMRRRSPVRPRTAVNEIDLEVSDEELMRISKDGVLALTLDEMQIIQAHYRDPKVLAERRKHGLGARPTDVELECLAQTWSEHCKHKIFAGTVQYEDENGQQAGDQVPVQVLHPAHHQGCARAAGGEGLLPVGLQGQRRRHQIQRRRTPWSSRSRPTTPPRPWTPTAGR